MSHPRELYYADHEEDFGLSGLTGKLPGLDTRTGAPDATAVLSLATEQVCGQDEDDQLGRDVRKLLASGLPEEALHRVWLAATRRCFDPAAHGMDTRTWLRRLAEACPVRTRKEPSPVVTSLAPVIAEEELRGAVLREIGSVKEILTRAVTVPHIAPALETVVTEADADLGLRLLLRVLKAYAVPVEKEQYDRLLALGDRLAYPGRAVFEGLHVRWPPLDPGRRDFVFDFGLPALASLFSGSWQYEGTVRETIERLVLADAGLAPGSQAAALLDDVLRLGESSLSTDTINTLWQAASNGGLGAGFELEGRDWLDRIADVCGERLREAAPGYEVPLVVPSNRPAGLTEAVLREVREAALVVTDKVVSPHRRPLPAPEVMTALEQVVGQVDPDLGFRLFLSVLRVLSVPVTREQYERYEAIGAGFGYGEHLVTEVEHLVRTEDGE
ncbi:hypothetical protein PV396_41165 [Streptomyces sp. ME02-8801-2C]|uniref:hypothetical protein n=1 Tax=Streptomyces sp. ME02-8801-2C TaxID=3028680 RepID=UPI0029B3E7E3|nr:hypothetical protein [Streptomyces sp. ME02-8801-2C]MDX3458277.1 hypothetical protein [Streptomyces sp. ME02-8801-2C]